MLMFNEPKEVILTLSEKKQNTQALPLLADCLQLNFGQTACN